MHRVNTSKLLAKYREHMKRYAETDNIEDLKQATTIQLKIHNIIKGRVKDGKHTNNK